MHAFIGKIAGQGGWKRLGDTLRYALHVIVRPFDGFWDLTREKRGSIAAANCIVFLTLVTRICTLQYTSFLFIKVHWEYVNLFEQCASILLPLLFFCLGNWGLTTLFDGKGTLRDIYMATAYALTPYVLINLMLIPVSNLITFDEGSLYHVMAGFSMLWCGYLFVVAMMMIHDYTLAKTLLFLLMSIFAMLVIIFLLLLFFGLISDGVGFFVSLYREAVFRLY